MKPTTTLVAASSWPSTIRHIRDAIGLRSFVDRATLMMLAEGCSRKNCRTIAVHDSKSCASKTSAAASAAIVLSDLPVSARRPAYSSSHAIASLRGVFLYPTRMMLRLVQFCIESEKPKDPGLNLIATMVKL
jgi:hypothetical protein